MCDAFEADGQGDLVFPTPAVPAHNREPRITVQRWTQAAIAPVRHCVDACLENWTAVKGSGTFLRMAPCLLSFDLLVSGTCSPIQGSQPE